MTVVEGSNANTSSTWIILPGWARRYFTGKVTSYQSTRCANMFTNTSKQQITNTIMFAFHVPVALIMPKLRRYRLDIEMAAGSRWMGQRLHLTNCREGKCSLLGSPEFTPATVGNGGS